jgi:putative rhamnosyltransferase
MRHDGIFDPTARYPRLPALNVVLTRCTMAVPWSARWAKSRIDAWLRDRLEVYSTFCVPSMLNQVQRPDVWLLGFDGEARDLAQPMLDIVKAHNWIVPVWQRKVGQVHEHPYTAFRREIVTRLESTRYTHVISTRLDNDDALNSWFVHHVARYSAAVIQNQPNLEDFWVSFPIGSYCYGDSCALFGNPTNHFLSRIQSTAHIRAEETSTALYGNHNRVYDRGAVFLPITQEPMWMEVAHDNNVLNPGGESSRIRFRRPDLMLRRFGIRKRKPKAPAGAVAPVVGSAWEPLVRFGRRISMSLGIMRAQD